jgi:hypothetical protein
MPLETDLQSLSTWLDGFLDGLGLCRVQLLVDARLETLAQAYAATSPDRVRAVVRLASAGDIDFAAAPGSLGA